MESLSKTLHGRHYGPHTVTGARWYGTVCNGPEQVVVQIQLSPTTNQPPADERRLEELRQEIRAAFHDRGWPSSCAIDVEFG